MEENKVEEQANRIDNFEKYFTTISLRALKQEK